MAKDAEPAANLWWHLQSILVAMDRLATAKKEKRALIQRSTDWMAEDRRRTIGDAMNYIGVKRLNDDVVAAQRALTEALGEMRKRSPEMLRALGKTEQA